MTDEQSFPQITRGMTILPDTEPTQQGEAPVQHEAPTPTQAPPKSPIPSIGNTPDAPEEKPRFTLMNPESINFAFMMEHGFMAGQMKLREGLVVTYRTLTSSDVQDVEGAVEVTPGVNWRYVSGEIATRQLVKALVAINGKQLPDGEEARRGLVDEWPAVYVNLLIDGYREFAEYTHRSITPEELGNF